MEDLGAPETIPIGTQSSVNWWKVAIYLIAIIALFLGGFFLGRKTIKQPEPDIIYIPGDTVKVNVPYPEPVYIKKPIDTLDVIADCINSGKYYDLFPEKVRDSIVYVTKEDTSAVIRDWATERFYDEQIFDIDTVGTASIKAKVQYNRLASLESTFVPITKVITQVKPAKKYSPFVGVGLSTAPSANLQGGMYFDNKYGASLEYQYQWQTKQHVLGTAFLIKF